MKHVPVHLSPEDVYFYNFGSCDGPVFYYLCIGSMLLPHAPQQQLTFASKVSLPYLFSVHVEHTLQYFKRGSAKTESISCARWQPSRVRKFFSLIFHQHFLTSLTVAIAVCQLILDNFIPGNIMLGPGPFSTCSCVRNNVAVTKCDKALCCTN